MRNQVQIQACTLVDVSFLFICLICDLVDSHNAFYGLTKLFKKSPPA